MITIAGINLPEKSIWLNRLLHGLPLSVFETDTDGFTRVFSGGQNRNLDIYIPNTNGGIKQADALILKELAASMAKVAVLLDDRFFTAVFRYDEIPIELKPSDCAGNMHGTLRLREV